MSYINTIATDLFAAPVIGAVTGVVGEKLIYGNQSLFFNQIPILSMFNGYNAAWAYALIFGSSIALLGVTGDFVKYATNNQYLSMLNSVSAPLSVGVLSSALLFTVDGFTFSTYPLLYAFLLGAVADVIAQWGANLFKTNVSPLLQNWNNSNSNSTPSFDNNSTSGGVVNNFPPTPSFDGGNQYSGAVATPAHAPIVAPLNQSFQNLFGLNGFNVPF